MTRYRRRLGGLAALAVILTVAVGPSQEARPFDQPESWRFSGRAWTMAGGRLRQDSVDGQPRAFYQPAIYGDVDVQVRFRVADAGSGVQAAGLILRSADSRSGFLIHYDCRNDQIIITRDGDGEARHEVGRKRGVPLDSGRWYTARTRITGETITVYLDGVEQLSLSDATLPAGLVGLYTSQGMAEFEAFEVTGAAAELPEPWRLKTIYEVPKEQAMATILSTKVIAKQSGRYIGWPTICRRRNGELLCVFSGDRDEHVCPWGVVQMVRSADDGETWSAPVTICNTPLDDRDAGIIETKAGTLVVAWFTSLAFESGARAKKDRDPVMMAWARHADKLTPAIREQHLGYWTVRSEDGGQTWDTPVKTKGSTPHGGIELADGRLLYVGRRNPHRDTELTVEESRDDGRSWQQIASLQTAPDDPITNFHEPHVVECADGKLVTQFRFHYMADGRQDNTKSFLRQAESTDGGHTWTTLHQVPLLGYPPHLLRLRNGWLLSVYGRRHGAYGEYACISRDNGETWDVDHEIKLAAALNGDLGYPASTQLADGSILTVFYQPDEPGEKTCLMGTRWRLQEE